MKAFLKTVVMLLLGVFVGLVAAVSYGGPVDVPIAGLLLASTLVGAGAVSVTATWNEGYGLAYASGVVGCTLALFFAPPGADSVVMAAHWVSYAWIVLSAVVSVGGVSATVRYRRKQGEKPPASEPVASAEL